MSISPLQAEPGTTPSLDSLLSAQRAAHLAAGPPTLAERRHRMDRLVLLLTENAERFAAALNADFGNRPRVVNDLSEIGGILPDIAATRARLGRWMKPRRVQPGLAALGVGVVVEPRPLGVVGIVGPWNFPIGLVAQPAASAFAAGNRVMIKMSEVTWRTADAFAEAASRYFDPQELAVVRGGADVAAEFCSLPFDHLFFTGSPAVGRLVARAAAANLVPVTLELGGKNPAVVAPGYSLSKAAERIVAARLTNGGQVCLCPDYVFVPARDQAEFVREALSAAARLLPTVADNPGVVSIVNEGNYQRVLALIEDARTHGAVVHQAAPAGELLPDAEGRRIPLTVLEGVTDRMDIASHEVFGPVLSVFGYDDITDVIDYVNRRPAPLAAYWYGSKGGAFQEFSRRVTSGGMTVNDFALHCAIAAAPFGGVGGSGYGAYHGRAGFDTFSHARTVATSRLPMSLASLSVPPFSPRLTKAVDGYLARSAKKAAKRTGRAQR
jgi:coniferyl-aldehyde dehydrogenase